jgi:hypothetical protein
VPFGVSSNAYIWARAWSWAKDMTFDIREYEEQPQPLLNRVATGSLSPGQISAPLRSVLSKQKNTRVLLDSVEDVRLSFVGLQ